MLAGDEAAARLMLVSLTLMIALMLACALVRDRQTQSQTAQDAINAGCSTESTRPTIASAQGWKAG
ncbi:MAG: hypothetical protein ACLQUZ_04525 [Rhizomicrobium sp.]